MPVFQSLTKDTLKRPQLQEMLKNYSLNFMEVQQNYYWTRCNAAYFIKRLPLLRLLLHLTENAAIFHSYRAYHQTGMEGWKCCPIWLATFYSKRYDDASNYDRPIAPPNLLIIVCCSCKSGCKTMTYLCRKQSLKCTDSCKECLGVSSHEVELEIFGKVD